MPAMALQLGRFTVHEVLEGSIALDLSLPRPTASEAVKLSACSGLWNQLPQHASHSSVVRLAHVENCQLAIDVIVLEGA